MTQDDDKEYKDAEASARRAVQLMEGAFGKNNPRNSTAYGTLAAILKYAFALNPSTIGL